MKKDFTHIISIFFLAVFLLNGMVSLFPLLSPDAGKQDIAELLAKTESENSGKEKEEKVPEREWIQDEMDIAFPAQMIISQLKKNAHGQSSAWKNISLTIFTPPPETA